MPYGTIAFAAEMQSKGFVVELGEIKYSILTANCKISATNQIDGKEKYSKSQHIIKSHKNNSDLFQITISNNKFISIVHVDRRGNIERVQRMVNEDSGGAAEKGDDHSFEESLMQGLLVPEMLNRPLKVGDEFDVDIELTHSLGINPDKKIGKYTVEEFDFSSHNKIVKLSGFVDIQYINPFNSNKNDSMRSFANLSIDLDNGFVLKSNSVMSNTIFTKSGKELNFEMHCQSDLNIRE